MSIITYDQTHFKNPPFLRTHDELLSIYESWLVKHHKNYNALGAKEKRFEIFKDNLRFIDEHNKGVNQSFKLGLNKFADLSNEEYKSMFLGGRMVRDRKGFESDRFKYGVGDELPQSVDWREKGAVAPVKDQGQCGKYSFRHTYLYMFFCSRWSCFLSCTVCVIICLQLCVSRLCMGVR